MALHHEAEELTVYVALEAKDYDEDAKRFRREHKEIEEELLALDHTKMDEFEYEKSTSSRCDGVGDGHGEADRSRQPSQSSITRSRSSFITRLRRRRILEFSRTSSTTNFLPARTRIWPRSLLMRVPPLFLRPPSLLIRGAPASLLQAHELGPTVPYPYASQAGGIVKGTLGVLKKPHDKLLNKVAGGTFAELKYAHPAPGQVETLRLHEQLLQISARNLKEKSKEEEVDFKHPLKPV
jgi:hypothetical protein